MTRITRRKLYARAEIHATRWAIPTYKLPTEKDGIVRGALLWIQGFDAGRRFMAPVRQQLSQVRDAMAALQRYARTLEETVIDLERRLADMRRQALHKGQREMVRGDICHDEKRRAPGMPGVGPAWNQRDYFPPFWRGYDAKPVKPYVSPPPMNYPFPQEPT
jgi:hypothetical protein